MNAQITDIHRQKQLSAPYFPYFVQLKVNPPTAHKGAIPQNIIIWVSFDASHQYTMSTPKLMLEAAMHHPRQKAQIFRITQVSMLTFSEGMFPISTHVWKIEAVNAISKTEPKTTAASDPISNTTVQTMLTMLLAANQICVLRFHTFLTRLQILTRINPEQITAQIVKKNPGGVTQSGNLSLTYLFLLIPMRQLTINVRAKRMGVAILMGHWYFPSMPKSPVGLELYLISSWVQLVSSFKRFYILMCSCQKVFIY